jgi:hypothetical protein
MAKRSKKPSSVKPGSAQHLSSEEFLKSVDKMWKAGPTVKYQNPDSW